nr:iron ABC transporter permease [Kibdelosporangium sp. MJ126-NF4]CEL18530.1 ABC transporter (iron.B12.siderophore.hemin), permease component [Kibdelosporangium sp. MJ126-NF4]CTQ98014.1 ABC transporter (iron.B12.siderophore.hemin), permease component [Kibdelosporangium sp. MJ126-NF4]
MSRTATGNPHLVGDRGFVVLVIALAVALVLAVAFAIGIGTVDVPIGDVVGVLWAHTGGSPDTSGQNSTIDQIVWTFRTPRVLLAVVAGGGLSLAGLCLQTLVRNPLADPYMFGVSAGASVGAVTALTFGAVAGLSVTGAAFVGALISVLVVFAMAQRGGRLAGGNLVLAGVGVAYLGTAITGYIQLQADPAQLRSVVFWLLGSVTGASWASLAVPYAATAVVALWLFGQGRTMNALSAGDDTAASLGINVNRTRIVLLVSASLLTAAVVSTAGGIGFVGLIVPHAARLVVGPDNRKVLPVSLLGGAVFLVLVDLVARTVDRPNEMPIGVFTAAIGAPFFLILLRRRRTGAR